MKNKPVRTVGFSDRVKGLSESEFRSQMKLLTQSEADYYVEKLGIKKAVNSNKQPLPIPKEHGLLDK